MTARNKWLAGFGALTLLLSAEPAFAQSLVEQIEALGEGNASFTGRLFQILTLVTVLSLAPSILIMVTSFVRIVVVLSLLRTALGTQQAPPNTVLISLAVFLTFFVMAPTLERAWQDGIRPMLNEEIGAEEGFSKVSAPFKSFMSAEVRVDDLRLFNDMAAGNATRSAQAAGAAASDAGPTPVEAVPLKTLIPAFMVSELRRAFEIGFLIFMPFLIIDLVTAALLMSMGMMMLPPAIVSLPFKVIFFVLIDGWQLVAGSLVQSFSP